MILLFDNTVTKEQADNPQWVWENWGDGIPCFSYVEAERLNRFYFGGFGVIGLLINYENAKSRGYIKEAV